MLLRTGRSERGDSLFKNLIILAYYFCWGSPLPKKELIEYYYFQYQVSTWSSDVFFCYRKGQEMSAVILCIKPKDQIISYSRETIGEADFISTGIYFLKSFPGLEDHLLFYLVHGSPLTCYQAETMPIFTSYVTY